MSYRREVENLLGKKCINKLVNHVRGGRMSADQLKCFVQHLGEPSNTDPEAPNVLYGNHLRRMRRYDRRYDLELLEVLSDWWAESLFEMTLSQALNILVKALCKPEVNCQLLAEELLNLKVANVSGCDNLF